MCHIRHAYLHRCRLGVCVCVCVCACVVSDFGVSRGCRLNPAASIEFQLASSSLHCRVGSHSSTMFIQTHGGLSRPGPLTAPSIIPARPPRASYVSSCLAPIDITWGHVMYSRQQLERGKRRQQGRSRPDARLPLVARTDFALVALMMSQSCSRDLMHVLLSVMVDTCRGMKLLNRFQRCVRS